MIPRATKPPSGPALLKALGLNEPTSVGEVNVSIRPHRIRFLDIELELRYIYMRGDVIVMPTLAAIPNSSR